MSAITTTSQSSITQHFNTEQLKVLKQQIAPKCSDTELDYFIEVCKQTNLSPFTREIYAISRETWNPETQRKEPKMSIQVSIDGLRKRAANSGYYDGSTTFWCGEDGKWLEVWLKSTPPSAAKTVVYRKGCGQPFTAVARFDAYKQDFKGKLSGLWEKMPDIMIGKCSEALALRKAFPEQTAGLYASEEMDQASNVTPQAQPISTPQPEIATGWDEKLWDIFAQSAARCSSLEDFESLVAWIGRKPQPNPRQDREINQIMKSLADELNNRTVGIPKPVKSAQVENTIKTIENVLNEDLAPIISSVALENLEADLANPPASDDGIPF
jgi:phage recombination protein Bet